METNRHLIDYLPPFIQDFVEIKHIMLAEQPEIDNLWNACENALNNQFIMYADEEGIKRWESIMRVTPKDTDSLEIRRFRLKTKMHQELPYTMRKLEESLTALCGTGNFSIDHQPENYHIEIRLALTNQNDYQEVVDLLTKMIPANMTQHVQILYNNNKLFEEFTHAELATYSHDELRKDVFE